MYMMFSFKNQVQSANVIVINCEIWYLDGTADEPEETETPVYMPDPVPQNESEEIFHDCIDESPEIELRRSSRISVPPVRYYDEYG